MNNSLKETLKQIGYDGQEVAIKSEKGNGYMLYSSKLNSYVYVPENVSNTTSLISVYSGKNDNSNQNYNTFIQNIANGESSDSIVTYTGSASEEDYKNSAIQLLTALENNGIKLKNVGFADSDVDSKVAEKIASAVAKIKQGLDVRSINLNDKNITDYEKFLQALKWLVGNDVDEELLKEIAKSLELEGFIPGSSIQAGGGDYYGGGGGGGYDSGSYYDGGGNSFSPASNGTVDVTYATAISGTNAIVSAINATTFPNETMNFKSTSNFLPSLNDANKYFYGATETLLKNISNDTQNIENILKNYATIDAQLANSANGLNGTALGGLGGFTNSIAIDKATIMSNYKNLASTFNNNYSKGKVGSIQMSDINSIYSGGHLTGALGTGLENEINSATNLKNQINDLINSNAISAPSWDLVKDRLGDYSELCDLRIKSAQMLEDAYEEALKLIQDYVQPDEYLDDGEIPEYEQKVANDEQQVQQLEQENAQLAQVQCQSIPCSDGNGSCGEDCSARDAAQAKIKANEAKIAELQAEIAKFKAFIEKLEGLAEIMNKANDIVQEAVNKMQDMYGSKVDEISPVKIEELDQKAGQELGVEATQLAATKTGAAGQPVFYSQKGYIDANGQYHTWESRWGKSISSSGCGPTSLAACLATMTGDTSITPASIADTMKYDENVGGSFIVRIAKERGLDMDYHIGSNQQKMDNHLANGGTMIVAVNGGGHYIAVLGKDPVSGNYIVCDPNSDKRSWSYNEIFSNHTMVFHIAPQGKSVAQTTGGTTYQI